MYRFVLIPFAVILIVLGSLFLLTPIPFGIPLLGIGGVILIGSSAAAARWLQRRRSGGGWLDRALRWLEARLPASLSAIFRRTRPEAAE